MIYLGDFLEDATVHFQFCTNAADGGRESFSASLEEGDIVIFKNNAAMTLDASTITITSDVGSRTGVHTVSVDMSNDADFTTGADYSAVLYASDETLDSQAPAGVLALWSCENRVVDVARMSGSDITKSSDNRLRVDVAEWNDIPLATTNPLPNAAPDAAGGLPISDAGGLDLDALNAAVAALPSQADITGGAYSLDTDANGRVRHVVGTAAGELSTTSGLLDGIAGTITTLDALDTAQDSQHSTTQGAIAALNDVSTTDLATALSDIHLDHLFATDYDPASKPGVGTALLNELVENDGGVSRFTVNALENAPSGSGASAASIADAVLEELISDHNSVSGSLAEFLQHLYWANIVTTGSVGATSDTTSFTTDLTSATNAHTCQQVIFTNGNLAGQSKPILSYINTNGAIDVAEALTEAPAQNDRFLIKPDHAHNNSTIVNAIFDQPTSENQDNGSFGKAIVDILAGTAELQTDWADGGRLDLIIDAILAGTNELQTDDIPGLIAALNDVSQADITGGAYALDTDANGRVRLVDGTAAGEIDLTNGLIAGIAGTIQTLDALDTAQDTQHAATQSALTTVDGVVDAIKLVTDQLPDSGALTSLATAAAVAALNDISVADILGTALTESYSANGAAPTLNNALMAIHQGLFERVYAGTTVTYKRLDNSTTAFVGTLNDASNPTSVSRVAA